VPYNIRFKSSVRKDMRRIPKASNLSILQKIQALADNPYPPGSEKLSGHAFYRIRDGQYRIVYLVNEDVVEVLIVRVAHRRSVYRGL